MKLNQSKDSICDSWRGFDWKEQCERKPVGWFSGDSGLNNEAWKSERCGDGALASTIWTFFYRKWLNRNLETIQLSVQKHFLLDVSFAQCKYSNSRLMNELLWTTCFLGVYRCQNCEGSFHVAVFLNHAYCRNSELRKNISSVTTGCETLKQAFFSSCCVIMLHFN